MRQKLVAAVICLVVQYYMVKKCNIKKRITYSMNSARERVREEVMYRIAYTPSGRDIVRMGPGAFFGLCNMLKRDGILKPTRFSSVEEQVAKALYILSHKTKNRVVNFWFRRSGETVSRHFHNVLRAIIELEDKFLLQPNGSSVPAEIHGNDKFYPYLKDCVGAIDGTHIRAKVRMVDAPRYRGRKDFPTQNVLAACTFDLKFTYVLVGWEGTASDSRTIKDALSREDCLKIPQAEPNYRIKPQKVIIVACCILHNYLMTVDPDAELIREVDNELAGEDHSHEDSAPRGDRSEAAQGELIRDAIAQQIWTDYANNAEN
ncbi:hypothetical protein K1719_045137 [Acacia pycnantha]|nr:hypothetical protein K1719_045137 [Acacia pycnantha]